MWDFSLLGNEVISRIIFLAATTPRDACRVASVSRVFRSIADSDEVWRQFLPPDHRDGVVLPQISRKKSLYLHLCHHPIPVGGNRNMEELKRKCSRLKQGTRLTSSSDSESIEMDLIGLRSRASVESHRHREWSTMILDPREGEPRSMRERGDGWLEIEMGEFYNENGDDGTLECSFKEIDEYTLRSGLVVEGIELRPKETY